MKKIMNLALFLHVLVELPVSESLLHNGMVNQRNRQLFSFLPQVSLSCPDFCLAVLGDRFMRSVPSYESGEIISHGVSYSYMWDQVGDGSVSLLKEMYQEKEERVALCRCYT